MGRGAFRPPRTGRERNDFTVCVVPALLAVTRVAVVARERAERSEQLPSLVFAPRAALPTRGVPDEPDWDWGGGAKPFLLLWAMTCRRSWMESLSSFSTEIVRLCVDTEECDLFDNLVPTLALLLDLSNDVALLPVETVAWVALGFKEGLVSSPFSEGGR